MPDETKPDQLPETEDETVNPLNIATDLLLDSTIPSPIRKNVFKALRQLSTATMEWSTAYLEGKTAEIRAGTKARIQITENITDQIIEQIKVPPEYAQSAVKKYGEKILREQVNLDKTSAIAANELKKEKFDSSAEQSAEGGEEKTISDDFLNSFEEEVRQKSSEEMQLLFGRILAGEIRKPGTYSTRTVKILGQLDQNVAILFKKLCSVCVVHEDPVGKEIFDARVPTLGGDPGASVLRRYGLSYEKLNILNEYGLIISSYNSWYEYNLLTTGLDNHLFALPIWHQDRYWGLFTLPGWNKSQRKFKLSGVSLSHAGCELFHLVDPDPMEDYTKEFKKFLEEQNLQIREINVQNGKMILPSSSDFG